MSASTRKGAKDRNVEKPGSKEQTKKTKGYVTLPATKTEKTDPEAIWEKPSFNPDVGDEDKDEARIVTNAVTEP
ncbi:MAG: hypothetical protein AB1489_28270 [Acidobacteriota bacterium]